MYPSKLKYDAEQLEELILKRINIFIDGINPSNIISSQTKKNSKLNRDFIVKYKFMQRAREDFLINSFWEIGMTDPFPDDEDLIIGSKDDVPDDFKLPEKP